MRHLVFALLLLLAVPTVQTASAAPPARPKLILAISIDQFRADYLTRFRKRFLPARTASGELGGFEYLMSQWAYFPYGTYDILHSMTGPGHATILSGSYPYQAGISLNTWFDTQRMDYVYCVEDRDTATVGATPKDTHVGTSPRNFAGSTVGDELKNAGYPSRVVAVALKDRAAILMGGYRADLALWWDGESKHWVSSKHYLPDGKLPPWVEKLNLEVKTREGETIKWETSGAGTGYSAPDAVPVPDEKVASKFGGKAFPHSADFGSRGGMALPIGLELTVTAAERAIDAYKLGQGRSTDLLAVSFSSHDYMGHAFGPNSREMEEMTVADDKMISRLLNYVREKVPGGLKETLIVLTADHGVAPNSDWLKANKVDAGRIAEVKLGEAISARIIEKYGKPSDGGSWVPFAHDFNFFFNQKAIAKKGLDLKALEAIAKDVLLKTPGVAHVFTASDYAARKLPPGMHERQILHTYYPGRSGDVVIIPKPFYTLAEDDTATHLTGYNYDRTVPIIFAGFKIKPGTYATPAAVIDIAPTLTFLTGTLPPALSEGRVLHEILEK